MSYRLTVFAFLVAAAGCNRQGPVAPERFAILRFENMGSDGSGGAASIDWMGRGFAEVIGAELAGGRGVSAVPAEALAVGQRQLGIVAVSAPGVSSGVEAAIAAGANRIGYGDYRVERGELYARLWVEDAQTHRYTRVVEISGPPERLIPLASRLAKAAAPGAAAYATQDESVLHSYCDALETRDAGRAVSDMESAIASDKTFGPAYRLLAEFQAGTSRDQAATTLELGLQNAAGLGAIDRARMEAQIATLRGDAPGKERALAAVAKLDAKNPAEWQQLADLAMGRRDYTQAAEALRALLALQPGNVAALNLLAYASAYAGDLSGSLAALDKYKALRPKDANVLDSRGDVLLLSGRLKEAEASYVAANQLDPNFQGAASAGGDLYKASMARLLAGDAAGADAIFQKYLAARVAAQDKEADFKSADWLWISGRQADAVKKLQGVATAAAQRQDKGSEAQAYSQQALWDLMRGDRAAAAGMAAKAAQTAGTGPGAAIGAIPMFLSQPSASAAEWEARADRAIRAPGQPGLKDMMLAYALLLDGKPAAAAAPLERARDTAGTNADEGIAVLLAWSKLESGNPAEAKELLRFNPIPQLTGPQAFQGLYIPRVLELRTKLNGSR